MSELSPEQIAEIRSSLDYDSDEFVQDRVVRDLCDTAVHLRARLDETAEYDDELAKAWEEVARLRGAVGEQTARGDKLLNRTKTLEHRLLRSRSRRDNLKTELEKVTAERDEAIRTRDEANIKLGTLEGGTVLERLGLVETTARMHAELEALRGIAKRVSDNWGFPLPGQQLNRSRRRWFRLQDGDLNWVGFQEEPMTPAEVQAIYGQKEDSDES